MSDTFFSLSGSRQFSGMVVGIKTDDVIVVPLGCGLNGVRARTH